MFCMNFRVILAFLMLGLPAIAAHAQMGVASEKSALKEGFAFPEKGSVRILLFRPDVIVGKQSTGGLDQPNADWTAQARDHLVTALGKAQGTRSNDMKLMPELSGEDALIMADYRSLFRVVADAALTHKLFPGNLLPTKKEKFDWAMGTGASRLGTIGGGDYGLFMYSYDSYGSSGRKALQVMGLLADSGASSGVHIGYAGLVDLKTGDLLWINADVRMRGDVRTAEGADKRVAQLLEDFPLRAGLDASAVAQ
jgi:hypothetical protein